MQTGNGTGLTPRRLGQRGGNTTVTAFSQNLVSHSHTVGAVNLVANKRGPGTDFFAIPSDGALTFTDGPSDITMDPGMIQLTGGGQPMQIAQPYLTVNWCISLFGIYPSRS
jgi:microcystin-dependent protein